ncbi:MAG: arsenite methyltransferase [Planctomycetes bacterium]|nr:arsenite methyltransferase [Planctomycetota bacterium]
MHKKDIKKTVKKAYGKIAQANSGCGCGSGSSCCGDTQGIASAIGYSKKDLSAIPNDANLGLGCGNPTALANLKRGETVLDLGSGAGIDCFIAANKVGAKGKVIGVDMTPEMIEKARGNARKAGITNVEFKLGEIENLPVENGSIDVVISNCVINLSPDKEKVFKEIHRTLKPGGKVAISDMALLKELPASIAKNIKAYVGCISGAILVGEYKAIMESAGFRRVKITPKKYTFVSDDTNDPFCKSLKDNLPKGKSIHNYVTSIYVEGCK